MTYRVQNGLMRKQEELLQNAEQRRNRQKREEKENHDNNNNNNCSVATLDAHRMGVYHLNVTARIVCTQGRTLVGEGSISPN